MNKKHHTPGSPPTPSASKRRLFFLLTSAFPFLFLIVVESTLRLIDYGGNLDLVVTKRVGGRECYTINRAIGRRYFAQPGSIVPQPVDGAFEIKKSKDTKRIFCLGESTMEGFPYEYHATMPSLIHDRLRVLLPQYNVEVINVGLSAIGTFVVQDFMHELLAYEPDLFLVYVGHNEFYGIFGVGSAINVPGGRWLTRLTLTLQKYRTFLLARDAYFALQRPFTKSEQTTSQSLMGQMVGNQAIPLRSDVYERGRDTYRNNINGLIETAQAHQVPIMFGTLVSNWSGQKPFVSLFDAGTSPESRAALLQLIAEGDSLSAHNELARALQSYSKAVRIDSMNAMASFTLGRCLYSLSRFDEAKQSYLRAKDLDALRFRATEEFENDLTSICDEHNVPLARIDSMFLVASPHGILDSTLFLEHLHPNITGYLLMAKAFCRAIEQHNLVVPPSAWSHTNEPADTTLIEFSRVTEFDKTVGKVKIDILKRRWPFETATVNYEFVAANPIESVVFRMMKGGIGWNEARYLLAEFYARNKQYDLAQKECLAVAKVFPSFYEPLFRYADYLSQEGKKVEAAAAYKQCFETDDNPFARMKYAVLLLQDGKASQAAAETEMALTVNEKGKYRMPTQDAAAARYLLGIAYARLGKFETAKDNLQRSLAIKPGYKEAEELLRQLDTRN